MEAKKRRQFVAVSRVAPQGGLLRLGPEPLSVAWLNPSRQVWVVGLGVCAEGEGDVELDVELPAGPWFGGWAFDEGRPWAGFPSERWVLPQVLAFWREGVVTLVAFGPAGTPRDTLERRLDAVHEVEPRPTSGGLCRPQDGARARFEHLVSQAISAVGGPLGKLVVTRPIELDGPVRDERLVLKALEARNPACWTFLVRGATGDAFVGASPELLCEVSGAQLETEALAGTSSPEHAERLLASEKDRREHQAVVDDVRARLDGWVTSLSVPSAPSLKTLSALAHLHTAMRGQLRDGAGALEVAKALHPTPAVAGTPRGPALDWLARHEGFSRGWYTGVVGARGPQRSTFVVAIRSALLSTAHATLFVGAGIVPGSTPSAEWDETERKARTMLDALGVEHG